MKARGVHMWVLGKKDCIVAINTFRMIVDLFVYSLIQSTACSAGKHLTNKQANPAFSKLERMQTATSAKDTKHFLATTMQH